MSDDAEARRQRARQLRAQIATLTGKAINEPRVDTGATAKVAEPEGRRSPPRVRPTSPRSLIEERMRELDTEKKKDS
jgi:hypothetical protein